MTVFRNQGLDHVAVAVGDVERSRRFYEEVVGLERTHEEWDMPVVMTAEGSVPEPDSGGENDDGQQKLA